MSGGEAEPSGTAERKQALREQLLAARLRLTPAERSNRSRAACDRLILLEPFRDARTVALYAGMGAEADPDWAARTAQLAGKRLAWPRVVAGSRVLELAACAAVDLVTGPRGTRHPPDDAPLVPLGEVDCIVVPGVAFDASGRRLGRGGAYYDATLAALPRRTFRVALAFDLQLVEAVPGEAHDHAVDAVVTDARVVWAAPAPDLRFR